MDPVTAAAVAMAVSGGVKAIGSVVEGQSKAKAYKAEASIADANARTALEQANLREEQSRREARVSMGGQAAAIAESGTGFTGSNLDIMRQSAATAELDALNTRYEGALQHTSLTNKAKGLRRAASDSLRAGWIGAGAQLISTAGSYAGATGGGGGGSAAAAG